MALHTPLTELFGIAHPIVLAPMGDVSGGRLAAAVSEGGGLGLIGGGRGDLTMLATECQLATQDTEKPWGIGLLTWAVNQEIVDWVIARTAYLLNWTYAGQHGYCRGWAGRRGRLSAHVPGVSELVSR